MLLSEHRLLVLKRNSPGGSPTKERILAQGIDAFEAASRYTIPLEEIRWVQIYPSLLSFSVKAQTGGSSYRFRLGRTHALKLEHLLRSILGRRVRRPGEY